MRAEGTKQFAAARSDVYRAAVDPERLMRSVYGVDAVEAAGEAEWIVRVRVPLGLTSLRVALRVERLEERAPGHARLRGRGRGIGGSISFDTTFDLAEAAGGGTQMHYAVEVQLGGIAGSAAGRVLQPVFRHQVDSILRRLERELDLGSGD